MIFKGSGTAIVTPFNDDMSVNYEAFDKLVDFQVENSTDALIVCGTTGESATLSDEEQFNLIKRAVERVNKRIPIIGGAGSNNTHHAVELAINAEKAGADALLLVTPYYNKTSQSGLIAHFTAIANAVNLPIIIYNVPSRTGCNIMPKTALALADVPNIVAIKEACGNLSQVAELAHLVRGKMDIYSGNDDQILPVLSLGGVGVISVLSNVAPQNTHDMVAAFLDGDMATATKLQLDAIPLVTQLFGDVSPIPVKSALKMMGFGVGGCRLPLVPSDVATTEKLQYAMKEYGLI